MIPERYPDQIAGVLSCYDRMILQGTLPGWCYDQGMTAFLYARQIKIFDYPQFAQVLRDEVRANAERIARENSIEIEFIRKINTFRKEARIKDIIKERGEQPGLVHVFSAMEACTSYKPWHDKKTARPISSTIPASACTIISTSSTKRSAYAICAFPPGHRSGSSSI